MLTSSTSPQAQINNSPGVRDRTPHAPRHASESMNRDVQGAPPATGWGGSTNESQLDGHNQSARIPTANRDAATCVPAHDTPRCLLAPAEAMSTYRAARVYESTQAGTSSRLHRIRICMFFTNCAAFSSIRVSNRPAGHGFVSGRMFDRLGLEP